MDHRSRVLRHADGPNLSNSCVSVAFLFLITRTSADQSTFVGYPSEDADDILSTVGTPDRGVRAVSMSNKMVCFAGSSFLPQPG